MLRLIEDLLLPLRSGILASMSNCLTCDATFKLHYRRGGVKQKFCSKACSYQANYETRTCKTCKVQFRANKLIRKGEYCSVECTQRNPCLGCGELITGRNKMNGGFRKYCSRKCASIHKATFGEKNYVVKGFAQTYKKFGKICCERCQIENQFVLQVHHKDENKTNNNIENLETICANCHVLEHWGESARRQEVVRIAISMADVI